MSPLPTSAKKRERRLNPKSNGERYQCFSQVDKRRTARQKKKKKRGTIPSIMGPAFSRGQHSRAEYGEVLASDNSEDGGGAKGKEVVITPAFRVKAVDAVPGWIKQYGGL
ncbi:hypothetical protein ACRALDRAFT_2021809 [Sodiomyces alcalophilus JCM 7366]|uniref:uncharacterized protein n=1 Tax=Sodiomyces alcalophilus JCM 7366 TaxID=591952 RepID=UPI0039B3696B